MSNIFFDSIINGLEAVLEYLSAHVLTCLIPAFFIAGAIAAFINKDIILKYFGPNVKRRISYTLAAVSGTVLAVCSCTILPLFAGIYKKGSGIGPAIAFLYAGPAINILAVIYTANILGFGLGAARAFSAILMSVVVGFIMAAIFKKDDQETKNNSFSQMLLASDTSSNKRPNWVILVFFILMVAILIFGASALPWRYKIPTMLVLISITAYLVLKYFIRDEISDWGYEIWDLTKKIFPMLILGTFIVGVIATFLPPETFKPFMGDNSILSIFLASIIGALLYMPTLLEVPIVGTTFGYSSGFMANGPALALLLAGPAVSLPNMIVLYRIIGAKKTSVYILLVILVSTIMGFIYGMVFN